MSLANVHFAAAKTNSPGRETTTGMSLYSVATPAVSDNQFHNPDSMTEQYHRDGPDGPLSGIMWQHDLQLGATRRHAYAEGHDVRAMTVLQSYDRTLHPWMHGRRPSDITTLEPTQGTIAPYLAILITTLPLLDSIGPESTISATTVVLWVISTVGLTLILSYLIQKARGGWDE